MFANDNCLSATHPRRPSKPPAIRLSFKLRSARFGSVGNPARDVKPHDAHESVFKFSHVANSSLSIVADLNFSSRYMVTTFSGVVPISAHHFSIACARRSDANRVSVSRSLSRARSLVPAVETRRDEIRPCASTRPSSTARARTAPLPRATPRLASSTSGLARASRGPSRATPSRCPSTTVQRRSAPRRLARAPARPASVHRARPSFTARVRSRVAAHRVHVDERAFDRTKSARDSM